MDNAGYLDWRVRSGLEARSAFPLVWERPAIYKWELPDLVELFQTAQEPLSFIRFGDGEFHALLKPNARKANCDGHPYSPALGRDLYRVMTRRKNHLIGLQPHAFRVLGGLPTWLQAEGMMREPWLDADVLHRASRQGRLQPFIDFCRERLVILVGPIWLERLLPLFETDYFVEVPAKNCYQHLDRLTDLVHQKLIWATHRTTAMPLVCVSAGMPAKVLIDRLSDTAAGRQTQWIDTGSVFDPLAGVKSRSYHAQIEKWHGGPLAAAP